MASYIIIRSSVSCSQGSRERDRDRERERERESKRYRVIAREKVRQRLRERESYIDDLLLMESYILLVGLLRPARRAGVPPPGRSGRRFLRPASPGSR